MAYQKPQAIIHQKFETVPRITEDELRAVIVGPSAILHRYADEDEKINIFVGIVDPENDQTFEYPGRSAGGIVDYDYSKLYVDNALLSYFNSADYVIDEEGLYQVKSGTARDIVYAEITVENNSQTLNGTTLSPEDSSSAPGYIADGTKVRLFKYSKTPKGRVKYKSADQSDSYTIDPTKAATYDIPESSNSDITAFIHLYDFVEDEEVSGSGSAAETTIIPYYVAFNKRTNAYYATTDASNADIVTTSEGKYPVFIRNKDEGVPMYQFYSPYKYDNAIITDPDANLFNFRDASIPRNGALGIRDVKVGDYALIWTNVPDTGGQCVAAGPQLSRIIGFVATDADPRIDIDGIRITQPSASKASAGAWKETITANGTAATTAGGETTLLTQVTGDDAINPFKYGILDANNQLSCTYKVTVAQLVESGNCEGTLFATVKCSQTGENRTIQLDSKTTKYTLSDGAMYGDTGFRFTDEQIAAIKDLLAAHEDDKTFLIEWEYSVTSEYRGISKDDFEILQLPNKPYSGNSDTYLFEVTKGITNANLDANVGSLFDVNTAYGRENVKNAVLSKDAWSATSGIPLGTQGLYIKFHTLAGQEDDESTSDTDEYVAPFSAKTGVPASFKLSIPVVAGNKDCYNGILLADNVDESMRPVAENKRVYLNLRLLYNDDIVLPAVSPVTDDRNWYQNTISFVLRENATMINPDFMTNDGKFIPLTLFGFGNKKDTEYDQFSKIFFNYREWSPIHATDVTLCETVSALDNIVGPLDPDNPLKYAVYKALTNSNGASVGYVAVKDPSDLDDWQDAMSVIEGRDDVYTIVPLSTEVDVQNLVLTLVNAESAAEACRWKTALFNMTLPKEIMRVGYSKTNETTPTSTDGKQTFCKIVKNPLDDNNPINKLVCITGNAKFIDYGVVSGDEVRILNNDGTVNATFYVDQIYSNGTLTLTTSLNEIRENEMFEVWHKYTTAEEVNLIRNRAQSVASRRVGLVWPDIVTEGGVEMPGYYLSAALAGLKSGVEPQQGLTRRTIQGFDGFTRSKPRYTESQLDLMAGSGVWICVTDSDGTPQSRHALNTDTTNSFYSEEMMTRNFDSVSKYMYQVIDAYIGTTNVTDDTLSNIYLNLRAACDYLIGKGQMIDYTRIVVKQHDLLLDRVLAYLDVGLPFAVNNVELFITAEAYKLNAVTLESEVE